MESSSRYCLRTTAASVLSVFNEIHHETRRSSQPDLRHNKLRLRQEIHPLFKLILHELGLDLDLDLDLVSGLGIGLMDRDKARVDEPRYFRGVK